MADLSTLPQIANVKHYAGDTLTIKVTAPAALTDGKTWKAVIKNAVSDTEIDASFQITPPAVSGGPAYLTLRAADSKALVTGQPVVMKVPESTRLSQMASATPMAVQQYTGVWDCQISLAGSDPVRTLCKGTFLVEMDVTP